MAFASDSGDDMSSISESRMMRELDDLDTFSPLPSAPVMPSSPSADAAARRSIRDLRGASFSSEMSDLPTSEAEEHTIEQEPSNIPEDHSSSTLSDSATSDHDTSTASSEQRSASDDGPLTPKASSFNLAASTHAQAPNTIAVDQSRRFLHPAVPATASAAEKLPRPPRAGLGSSMALKEQSNLVDRLSKENWGLKMRIHFLDQDLAKLSREGTDNMISENASLKLDVFRLQKDNKDLRKKIRILESNGNKGKIGERSPDRIATPDGGANASVDQADLVILRERIETYEIEIKKLREESIARESEKRQLAEMVKALNERKDSGASDVSAREERDWWKDEYERELARREHAEAESKRIRDELDRLRHESRPGSGSGSGQRAAFLRSRGRSNSEVSRDSGSDALNRSKKTFSSSSRTAVGQLDDLTRENDNLRYDNGNLRHENEQLRIDLDAQVGMLSSRNREKENLTQEVEDLRARIRRRGGSIAGESILERSASQMGRRTAMSEAGDNMRIRRLREDHEREVDELEARNGDLRDQVSSLRIQAQTLRDEIELLNQQWQKDVDQGEEDFLVAQDERDAALQRAAELQDALRATEEDLARAQADLENLQATAQNELEVLENELQAKNAYIERLEAEIEDIQVEFTNREKTLQTEVRSAAEGILRLEEDAQENRRNYDEVRRELDDANKEIESLEETLVDSNNKIQRLTVQQESSKNEIAFLREDQDGDKIKISELESASRLAEMNLQSEREKTKQLDKQLAEERHQREVVGGKEKQETQKVINELNRQVSSGQEEIRKLKKSVSSQEIEATTWKERLMELESGLREALGDLNGTRSSLLTSITRLQQELDSTLADLEATRRKLDEKETLLKSRDSLLESHGLESRKLADLLERERSARRADKHSFEQSLKSHQQASRTITHNNSKISDLEAARQSDRKKFATLEQQYKDQLSERNAILLQIWKKVSAMCGPDWAHSNSLIQGNLPSQEVIGNILFWPSFVKNLLLAVKTVQTELGSFRDRIKNVEQDLWKEYQELETNVEHKGSRIERLEELVRSKAPLPSSGPTSPDVNKLRGENRLLKAEVNLLHAHNRNRSNASDASAGTSGVSVPNSRPARPFGGITPRGSSTNGRASAQMAASLIRHNSTSAVETLSPTTGTSSDAGGSNTGDDRDKWLYRLREMEKRLKQEREARLMDRSGARKRLEERNAENEELRQELEREKQRRQLERKASGAGKSVRGERDDENAQQISG